MEHKKDEDTAVFLDDFIAQPTASTFQLRVKIQGFLSCENRESVIHLYGHTGACVGKLFLCFYGKLAQLKNSKKGMGKSKPN